MNAETLTSRPIGNVPVIADGHGAHVRSGKVPRGRRVSLQVTCRSHGAPLLVHQGVGFGTPGADGIATGRSSGATAFGGPRDDRIRVRAHGGLGNGGLGAHTIIVAARNAVANGGPGDDRLIARTGERTLLVGGPGHDTLVGSRAATVINAKDGDRDLVICRSRRNRVLVDRRDVVQGPCRARRHL